MRSIGDRSVRLMDVPGPLNPVSKVSEATPEASIAGDNLGKQCTDLKKQIYERWERSILRRNNFTPTMPLQGSETKPAANGEPKILRGREGVASMLSAGRRSPSAVTGVSGAKASSSGYLLRRVGANANGIDSNEIKDARDLVAVLDKAARDSLSSFQKRMSEVDAELAQIGSRPSSSSESSEDIRKHLHASGSVS